MTTRIAIASIITASLLSFPKKEHSIYSLQRSDANKDTSSFKPGAVWYDEKGEVINAHGGGILFVNKTYYWFGEKRNAHASQGVTVYSSKDLYRWKYEG